MARKKFLLVGLILLLGALAVIRPISADLGVTITNSGDISVLAGQSGSTTITFHDPSAPFTQIVSVTVSCSGLPAGAICSTNPPAPTLLGLTFFDGGTFDVVVNTSPSTPPGIYPITVTAFFSLNIATIIQPWIPASTGGSIGPESVSIQAGPSGSATTTFNLIVSVPHLITGVDAGSGSVNPNCPSPSGCSETIGSSQTVTATPSSGFQFSSWSTQTGISCSSNPCVFTMPTNNVVLRATFTLIPVTSTTTAPPPPIPEYPLGLPILAILTVIAYGVIRRKTVAKQK